MPWTSAQDLRVQTQKLWDKGLLLAGMVKLQGDDTDTFPKRLQLKCPTTSELSSRFNEVRDWAESLRKGSGHYRLVERDATARCWVATESPMKRGLTTCRTL